MGHGLVAGSQPVVSPADVQGDLNAQTKNPPGSAPEGFLAPCQQAVSAAGGFQFGSQVISSNHLALLLPDLMGQKIDRHGMAQKRLNFGQ